MSKRLTSEQSAAITAYTGISTEQKGMSNFHKVVEKKLDRPVYTHEFASEKFWDEVIKPAFKEDFINICYEEPDDGR